MSSRLFYSYSSSLILISSLKAANCYVSKVFTASNYFFKFSFSSEAAFNCSFGMYTVFRIVFPWPTWCILFLTYKFSCWYLVVTSGLKSLVRTTYSDTGSNMARSSAIFFLSSNSLTFRLSLSLYNLTRAYLSSNNITLASESDYCNSFISSFLLSNSHSNWCLSSYWIRISSTLVNHSSLSYSNSDILDL